MSVYRIEIQARPEVGDSVASHVASRMSSWLGLTPRKVMRRTVYHLDLDISPQEATSVAQALIDPVSEIGAVGMLPDEFADDPPLFVTVGFRPGVTDTVGTSVKRAAEDRLGRALSGAAYASTMYLVWGLQADELQSRAGKLLFNHLIERMSIGTVPRTLDLDIPRAGTSAQIEVASVPLRSASDEELLRISREGVLALNLAEMKAIQAHFAERGRDPHDAELECIAQTWSEHCKHKIFASPIDMVEPDGSTTAIDDGLFRRYIRGATEAVSRAREAEGVDPDGAFLVSVFHDNAGVVRFTDEDHLAYKVETHNSPSALDPYGGAMTGIVGVNRDSFGTGRGADLLTNVWGYCLGSPHYEGSIPQGLMHPRRIRDGVHRGVIDGGNQSGIPYARGFELFDERYLGKPLVFCGTVSVMPAEVAGVPTHEKPIRPGDRIVMVGGRIGKDGIHGATFSSVELDESSPVQAVQIGDPITQKMMFEMLTEARDRGLISGMTDNGAGGLSSSVGEMAEFTSGAQIDLARAPLKYPGLAPWEVLISEAQERMTVAVRPENLDAFIELARLREVEATDLGEFTESGRLVVTHADTEVVDLPLSFLHDGLPKTRLSAKLDWPPRPAADPQRLAAWMADDAVSQRLLDLVGSPEHASNVGLSRRYDHEVKGLSVVKPLVGHQRDVTSAATVLRARHGRPEGVVLGEGIHPYYSDLDARQMALAAVDEAVRRVLCAGAELGRLAALDNFCWPDPVRSDKTPDGEHKLALLVECCRGLREACEAYGLPLVSGKDSMKNDATLDGVKISIPPTLLVSVMGQMPDVTRVCGMHPRQSGHQLWLLGATRDELGSSAVMRRGNFAHGVVPKTDPVAHAAAYAAFCRVRDRGLVASAHVCGRGGLGVALAQLVLASGLEIDVCVPELEASSAFSELFSETTGRIVFSAAAKDAAAVEAELRPHGVRRLAVVGPREAPSRLRVSVGGRVLVDLSETALRERFESGLAVA